MKFELICPKGKRREVDVSTVNQLKEIFDEFGCCLSMDFGRQMITIAKDDQCFIPKKNQRSILLTFRPGRELTRRDIIDEGFGINDITPLVVNGVVAQLTPTRFKLTNKGIEIRKGLTEQ